MRPRSGVLLFSERVYRNLLCLYPAGHRRQYGPQMVQLFRDMCHQTYHREQSIGLLSLWLHLLPDLAVSVGTERISDLKGNGMRRFCGQAKVDPSVTYSLLASAAIMAFGVLAKPLIIASGGTIWMATTALIGANLTAAAIMEIFAHTRGKAIIPMAMLAASAILPLLWVKDIEGWLRGNPISVSIIIVITAYWYATGRERPVWPVYLVGTLLAAAQIALSFLE